MLYVDIPTLPEFRALAATRADACVSIYLPTTPISRQTAASRIALKNLTKTALDQLASVGFDKRRLAAIADPLAALASREMMISQYADKPGLRWIRGAAILGVLLFVHWHDVAVILWGHV